jgi:cell wall-associated NlpC family hydrolase
MLDVMRRLHPLRAAVVVVAASLGTACATTRSGVPRPFPMPQAARTQPLPDRPSFGTTDTYALVGTALSFRGTPYRNGGADPSGFDCSGFTQYVFAQYGMSLPREVRDQFEQGNSVKDDELSAGDLLFFTTVAPGPTHVGIAIGGDEFVHAPSSTGVVRVEHLSSSYWARRYLGARRFH